MPKAKGKRKSATPVTASDGCKKGEFIVEKIVGKRIKNGSAQYLLKWKNFSAKQNTWEPEENLNCKELLEQYTKEEQKKKPGQSTSSANGDNEDNAPKGRGRGRKRKIDDSGDKPETNSKVKKEKSVKIEEPEETDEDDDDLRSKENDVKEEMDDSKESPRNTPSRRGKGRSKTSSAKKKTIEKPSTRPGRRCVARRGGYSR